jgi:hypothetical protein
MGGTSLHDFLPLGASMQLPRPFVLILTRHLAIACCDPNEGGWVKRHHPGARPLNDRLLVLGALQANGFNRPAAS